MELSARNVNRVWSQAVRELRASGVRRNSRNGPVIEYPEPVVSVYECPQERVLFDPIRDANPFFHLFESLWILAGRNDVFWPAQFAERLKDYSDDGETFHGAYGHRLRYGPGGHDQIALVVQMLKDDPTSRRAVLQIWDAHHDLAVSSKDIPCNTQLYLKISGRQLRMTVCNRSNDICWGLYGANAVQWSMLQEYLASKLGVLCGPLTTVSDSFHAYLDNPTWTQYADGQQAPPNMDPYEAGITAPWPLMEVPGTFDKELERFLNDPADELAEMFPERKSYLNSFYWVVAVPMFKAWRAHKANKTGLTILQEETDAQWQTGSQGIDWIGAARSWLERREVDAKSSTPTASAVGRRRRGHAPGSARQVRG